MILGASRENLSSGFPTRSDTKLAVQPQKMVKGLIFWIRKWRYVTICIAKTKAVTVQLIYPFVFEYAKNRFSNLIYG